MSLESLRDFVKEIEKDEKNSHGYRAHASFLMLEHVDLMISRFQMEKIAIEVQSFSMFLVCSKDFLLELTHYMTYPLD